MLQNETKMTLKKSVIKRSFHLKNSLGSFGKDQFAELKKIVLMQVGDL